MTPRQCGSQSNPTACYNFYVLKRIPAVRLREVLRAVLDSVHRKGEEYIVERNGKPLAAVVPVGFAVQREQARRRLLEIMDRHTPVGKMSDSAVNKLVNEEIHKLRRQRRRSSQKAPHGRAS